MAQIQLPPPDRFNFRNPDDWPRWRRRFQQFREAYGFSGESAAKQISTLLYCLGEETESVLASTNATADDRNNFNRTIGKFDDYFKVRKNVIYERARFNRRNQQSGETAENYIVALYELAEHCDYGDMTAELIRDRLVVGIRDSALSEKLQMDAEELEKMENSGIISKVTEPTPWCAGMVVVPKKSGKPRICVDLKPLNQNILREVHPLPEVDETLAQLTGAKVFSKLDASSGFWQIPLSQQSRHLTTFITPMGRYCFNKLPFGISSAPEHFQRRMSELLNRPPGSLLPHG